MKEFYDIKKEGKTHKVWLPKIGHKYTPSEKQLDLTNSNDNGDGKDTTKSKSSKKTEPVKPKSSDDKAPKTIVKDNKSPDKNDPKNPASSGGVSSGGSSSSSTSKTGVTPSTADKTNGKNRLLETKQDGKVGVTEAKVSKAAPKVVGEPEYFFTYQIRSIGDGNSTLYHLYSTCNVLNVDVSNWKADEKVSCRMGMYYETTGVSDWVYLNHQFSNPLDKTDKWVCKDLYSE